MRTPFIHFRPFVLLALITAGLSAQSASLQDEFLTFGEPLALPEDTIVTAPAPPTRTEGMHYDDTSWKSQLFGSRSPLIVYHSLQIKEDGSIGDVVLIASSGRREFDEAIATQLASSQRRFTPGKVRGRPVVMPYLQATSYVPEGKQEALRKKQESIAGLVDVWKQQQDSKLAELRSQALAQQAAERTAWRERYAREAPYRLLPSTPLSDADMVSRILQLRHLLTYCGGDLYHRFGNEVYQYAGGQGNCRDSDRSHTARSHQWI